MRCRSLRAWWQARLQRHPVLLGGVAGAAVLAALPVVCGSGLGLSLLSQAGWAVVICLSYNLLLGHAGLLSFGHAVYVGVGALAAIHTVAAAGQGGWPVPLWLVPLVGGLAGAAAAAVTGVLTTRAGGTAFAMITLGLGEWMVSLAHALPQWFGGEAGLSANRVYGTPWWGLSFGPAVQVYYLIASYGLLACLAFYGFTRTPLGRLINAARDNPLRLAFLGYNPQGLRYRAFVLAGLLAGVGGALAAIQLETFHAADSFSTARSANYLLFTFLGGVGSLAGSVVGGVLMVLAPWLLPAISRAWLLYLGLAFMWAVLYAPGGLAGLAAACRGQARSQWPAGWRMAAFAVVVLGGVCLLGTTAGLEMLYRSRFDQALGPTVVFAGLLPLDTQSLDAWAGMLLVTLASGGLFAVARRHGRKCQSSTPVACSAQHSEAA